MDGLSSIQYFLDFGNFFNFAKPLICYTVSKTVVYLPSLLERSVRVTHLCLSICQCTCPGVIQKLSLRLT